MAKQSAKPEGAEKPTEGEQPGRIAKLRAAVKKRIPKWSKRTLIGVAILAAIVVGHSIALWLWAPKYFKSAQPRRFTLPMALAALDRNSQSEAKYVANKLLQAERPEPEDRGGAAFVLGAVAADEAKFAAEDKQQTVYASAAKLLEEARLRGWPKGRQPQGLFLLGKSQCLSGDNAAARATLEESLHDNPQPNVETYRLLAQAFADGDEPDDKQALVNIKQYLADTSLDEENRSRGLLLEGQILDKLSDIAMCREALAKIPTDSATYPAALMLEAEVLMREGRALLQTAPHEATEGEQPASQRTEANVKYRQAIDILATIGKLNSPPENLRVRAAYLIGVCLLEAGDLQAAQQQFHQVCDQNPGSDEGIAAGFLEADVLRRLGRNDEAIARYGKMVKEIGNVDVYRNSLLPIESMRAQLLAAYEKYLRGSQIEQALSLSQVLHPLFPRERELELNGKLFQAAAKTYLEKAVGAAPDRAKLLAAKGRANFRQAGRSYAKLAELQIATRAYADDLWNAVECYFQGHDYIDAAATATQYLKNESRRRQGLALAIRGESELTLGQIDKALVTLQECIDAYPNDPAIYQARLLAAKACLAKDESDKAESLLKANLQDANLTPRSTEWRDSLFALGFLLQASGRWQDAIARLEEAVARYPDAPQAIEARYLTADCYRKLALAAREKLQTDTIESLRAAHETQLQDNLNASLKLYEHLEEQLTDLVEHGTASALDQTIFRNCYFSQAGALFDLKRYDDAIRVYTQLTTQYRTEPEALDAFVQLADCYKKLDRPAEARGT
ncbi:MAG TPA: tetratricopeptide repeat protein, partial [Pirellulales bacterium]